MRWGPESDTHSWNNADERFYLHLCGQRSFMELRSRASQPTSHPELLRGPNGYNALQHRPPESSERTIESLSVRRKNMAQHTRES
jgi:hypothetical protein